MRDHWRRTSRPLLTVSGLMMMACSLALTLAQYREQRAVRTLSDEARIVREPYDTNATTGPGGSIDWVRLRDVNPDIAAWVRVEGTEIDLPVLAPADGDMSFYLQHDLWGNWSIEGAPFLDHRSHPDGTHRLVYGHHLFAGGQFSELQKAYEQEVFDSLGACRWVTPQGGECVALPFCALRVDAWFADIQSFEFGGGQLETWLCGLAAHASATSRQQDELARGAHSVVTLVTCSSDFSGQPWRTLTVFVEPSCN